MSKRYLWIVIGACAVVAPPLLLRSRDAPPTRVEATASTSNAPFDDGPPRAPEEIHFQSGPNKLRGFLFVPQHPVRAPAIVYNHGSEQDPDLRYLGELGQFFQAHGFVALFPWRQGCSGSEGRYWEERVPIEGDEADMAARERRNIKALEQDLSDVLAGVDYVKSLAMVDPARVSVGGSSFGGLLSLMAAARSTAIRSAIACSGAAWTYRGNTHGGQEKLDDLARSAKVPIFFYQAANDFNQGSSEALGEAMQRARLAHHVEVYPPHGKTQMQGHAHFCNHGMSAWGEDVLTFLSTGG